MVQEAISSADLRTIERNLDVLAQRIGNVDVQVNQVDNNVTSVQQEVADLQNEFRQFVQQQTLNNNLSIAETRIVKIRQEIEKNFGHYDEIRRTTLGILQANDLAIVRKETIASASESMMLSAPGYWLAPCLVALSAWINDDAELANRALDEALVRDGEKTALLFALICRRANRKQASLQWTAYYLQSQNETALDRNAIVIIDAFANGLLGVDSEGIVSKTLETWLKHLSNRPNFTQQQEKQWGQALALYRPNTLNSDYPMLKAYSTDWSTLEDTLKGAYLHRRILSYFENIFNQPVSTDSVKQQLDQVLLSLVSKFDNEELKLKKQEKLNQLIIDFDGDKKRAQQNMTVEKNAYDEKRDFSQLLTDAALMNGASEGSISTQKFAIALSKDWIKDGYQDLVASNRAAVPDQISFEVEGYQGSSENGDNELASIEQFQTNVENNKEERLKELVEHKVGIYGGIALAVLGIMFLFAGDIFTGLLSFIVGAVWAYGTNSKNSSIRQRRKDLVAQYDKTKQDGTNIIRQIMAEIVDYRDEFELVDAESTKVVTFLDELTPNQYIRSLKETSRHINVGSAS
ncbi:hypothetical protein C6Y10_12510 [Lactiplantibacillus pentosus]|uniref:hypothetical protein n=1 Tax=Lactiplantibacillus pentosus TaxID=1589 RepID=UPI000D016D53|nr:hypothetical protein [Lactiplantibacillus pentosus]PRO82479.1 hypothetical protein C6Y10_12510 [Lactiplantibacillus pentosus]